MVDEGAVELEAAQDVARHARAHVLVAEEVHLAIFDALGARLGDVVQEARPAGRRPRGGALHHAQNVLVDILGVRRGLADAAQFNHLRDDVGHQAKTDRQAQPAHRIGSHQEFGELVADTLAADLGERRGRALDRLGGVALDLEVELRGEATGAQHP